jgi:hypothetical protein
VFWIHRCKIGVVNTGYNPCVNTITFVIIPFSVCRRKELEACQKISADEENGGTSWAFAIWILR